jgi:hypothetical protein
MEAIKQRREIMKKEFFYLSGVLILLTVCLAAVPSIFAQGPLPGLGEEWTAPVEESSSSVTLSGPIGVGQSFSISFEDRNGNRTANISENNLPLYITISTPPGLTANTASCIQYYPPDNQIRSMLFSNMNLGPSGTYKLGPYSTNPGDPYGKYALRVGLLSRDATGRRYWTEQVGFVNIQQYVPPPPEQGTTVPTTNDNGGKDGTAGISWWLYVLVGLVVGAAVVVAVLSSRRTAPVRPASTVEPTTAAPQYRPETETRTHTMTRQDATDYSTQTTVAASPASLVLPNGNAIPLAGNVMTLGRRDFEGMVPPDKVSYVSRNHITIGAESGQYYIVDQNSTNGTKLNDAEIKGMGKKWLRDGDKINVAGAAEFTFRTQ